MGVLLTLQTKSTADLRKVWDQELAYLLSSSRLNGLLYLFLSWLMLLLFLAPETWTKHGQPSLAWPPVTFIKAHIQILRGIGLIHLEVSSAMDAQLILYTQWSGAGWETTVWEGDKEQVKNDQPYGLWSATWADATIFHAIVLYLPVIPQGSGHAPASVFTFAAPFA